MAEKIKVSATGQGPGTVPFTLGANGKLSISGGDAPAVAAPAVTAPPDNTAPLNDATLDTTAETPAAPSPFGRMYPGVDPAKVEMVVDHQTGRIKFKMAPEPALDDLQDDAPPAPALTPSTP